MKPISLVITASLAANAALLAALFLHSPNAASPSHSTGITSKSSPSSTTAKNDPTAGVDPALWKNVGDSDFAAQVTRLRAAGFPPALVRAIMTAQIYESFAAKRNALNPPANPAEFWKNDPPADPKNRAALRQLQLEQTRLINELLGTDPTPPGLNSIYERRQYAGIPSEKIDQVARVKRDYSEMQQELMAGFGGGVISPDDSERLALLRREERNDIARLLTPQEMEDYDLRTNNTAMQMRYELGSFNPSEAEFRTIFQLQKNFDEKYRSLSATQASNQDYMRERQEAQKQVTEQIKAALGPQRAADYERAKDYSYQAIDRVVNRLGLPATAANDAYALQKDIQQRAQVLQTNRQLTPDARNAELAALNTEATTKLTTALGERGFDVYKQNGGQWMQILQPRPLPPAGARGGPGGPPPAGTTGGGATIIQKISN